ncbi:MAG: SPOR domain-containing protein [Spongiibacteraceae bacterium]
MVVEELRGDSLKQRLVGGIALLVIGIVAWFWLLSADSPVDPVSRTTQIPPAPDIQPFDVPEPTPPAATAPINSERDLSTSSAAPVATVNNAVAADKPAPAAVPESSIPSSVPKAVLPKTQSTPEKVAVVKSKETFELDQQGLPVAWVIQVGLFSTQAKADDIKSQLQQKGFKAYTESYKTASTPKGFKVFVGPKLSRERAAELKRSIDTALKVDSKIVRFQPPPR